MESATLPVVQLLYFVLYHRADSRPWELNSFWTKQNLEIYCMKKFNYLLRSTQSIGQSKISANTGTVISRSRAQKHRTILICSPANQTMDCHFQFSLFLVVCYSINIYLQYHHEMWLLWRSTASRRTQNNSFHLISINSKTNNILKKESYTKSSLHCIFTGYRRHLVIIIFTVWTKAEVSISFGIACKSSCVP